MALIFYAFIYVVVKFYMFFLYTVHVTQLKGFVILWAWSLRSFFNMTVLDFCYFFLLRMLHIFEGLKSYLNSQEVSSASQEISEEPCGELYLQNVFGSSVYLMEQYYNKGH
jgi:hypothetical protein